MEFDFVFPNYRHQDREFELHRDDPARALIWQMRTGKTKAMVDLFLSNGFTYFDTAYGYIDGKSEEAARTCIVDRYPRESFRLATKLPAWAVGTAEEAKAMLADDPALDAPEHSALRRRITKLFGEDLTLDL